ncbi:hypothetical protein S40293_09522 [Stachybotrys chartarum IBT 40293]|nr:hypothetical protein S40293_09522 [Stachybotrys chartarum IBT 40293]
MANQPPFNDYPKPVQGPDTDYVSKPATNPVLRGYPLSLAATVVSSVPLLQRYYWNVAGFGTVKDLPVLDDLPTRFHPCVTPLGDTQPMVPFTSDHLKAKYTALAGRYYTISDYHELYKSGKATPLEVVEALLEITTRRESQYADAWADSHGEDHRAVEAARASTKRYAAGEPLGILDGVPFGVKDDLEVEGYICHLGVKYDSSVPEFFKKAEETVYAVRRLQEAGAIVLGKNRMHQLGADTSGCNPTQGTPTNHMNKSYYTGGSSSGGSSALGAGIVPFVVGTDSGGSTRIPAVYNGVYGMKTSHHRTGLTPHTNLVASPIAASVADLTVAYRVMSQPDPACATQSRFAVSQPPGPGAKRVMGIYRDWWKEADPRVVEVCDGAVKYFEEKLGYEVVDISIPHVAEARISHTMTLISEVVETIRSRAGRRPDWLSLLSPPNKFLLSVAAQTPASDYLKGGAMRELLMRHLAFLFQKHPGLLIMTPASPLVGWPRAPGDDSHGFSDTNTTVKNMVFTFLANFTGTPAVAAPVGYVEPEQGEGWLPIGLMATGEWGSEEQLLSWAAEAEQYLHETYEGGRVRPKSWLDVMDLVSSDKDD